MKIPKKYVFIGILIALVVVAVTITQLSRKSASQNSSAYANGSKASTGQPTDTPESNFNKKQHSLTDPNSPWVIVNKRRPLPVGFAPTGLVAPEVNLRLSAGSEEMQVRQEVATAMEEMFKGASAAGYKLMLASGYRSEVLQKTVYNGYVAQKGQQAADEDSARPGYSEHQTGLAFDVGRADRKCEVDPCFTDTPEGKWVAANAYKYGLVVRYMPDKKLVTGYIPEAWHLRYVGKELAKAVYDSGQTLEEFFELAAAPEYN